MAFSTAPIYKWTLPSKFDEDVSIYNLSIFWPLDIIFLMVFISLVSPE